MNASAITLGVTPSGTLQERIRDYWRHRAWFFAVAGLALALTFALALLLPPTYVSQATILIEQQEIPQDLVRSAITTFADQRVQTISQRVMTTQNLMTLIDRYNLYPDIRLSKPREVLLKKMRDNISMKMISADVIDPRSGRPTQATIAFSVGFASHSPELALKVANDITSLYLNENLTSRQKLAEQTSSFFAEESDRQQQRIAELDKQLADFKQKHEDRLPEQVQLLMTESERTEIDIRDVENRIAALDSQKVMLEAQLAQINPTMQVFSDTGQRVLSPADRLTMLKSQLAEYKARYAPGHPDIIATERAVAGLEKEVGADDSTNNVARELSETQAELAKVKERYSPDHPDVIRLTHKVEDLQKQVASAPALGATVREHAHPDNPAYIQVQGQIDAVTVERESALKKHDELRLQLSGYERRLAEEPAVEKQYRELARDLDTAQLKYQEIRSKQTEAQVSENLETQNKGERFTMIEPPLPPEKPVSPNRFLILALGFVLSAGAGAGATATRSKLDVSVRGSKDVRSLLSVPPLATIPSISTIAEVRRALLRRRLTIAGLIVGFAALLVIVHFFVRPLDVLWSVLVRRFGF